MRLMKWAAMSAAIATAGLLAACGGSGSSSSAQLRLINASAGYNSLDLTVNNVSLSTGTAYGAAGAYGTVDTANSGTQVIAAGTTVLSRGSLGLVGNNNYSMIVYGWPSAMNYTMLQEAEPAPAAGSAKLLVLNLAPDAGPVNVYLTPDVPVTGAAPFASSVLGGSGSGYLLQTKGTYHVRVTGSASTDVNTDVRLDITGITLADASVNTLVITPTSGGVMVNALTVVQGGEVKSYGGTNARIRVIGSVLGTGGTSVPVVAARDGVTLLNSNSNSPLGSYQIVGANSNAISLTVNGVVQTPVTPALAAGNDYTVLIWGPAAAPNVQIITDDNRLPNNGYAKVRLINGAANSSTVMNVSLNLSPIFTNVMPGTSTIPVPVVVTGVNSTVSVSTPSLLDPLFTQSQFTFENLGVYTVYMLANDAATNDLTGIMLKDR